jgi:predicted DNA-binding antitoxin AbrB/MazE fold protein
MPLQIDAVYENGVLRPLQPLDLKEHEHVLVSIVAAAGRSSLAVHFIENIQGELAHAEPTPGLKKSGGGLPKFPDRWPLKLSPIVGNVESRPVTFSIPARWSSYIIWRSAHRRSIRSSTLPVTSSEFSAWRPLN